MSRASMDYCRLRLGLSALNFQRFQYSVITNNIMSCNLYNDSREDVQYCVFIGPALLPTAVMQNKHF